MDDVFVELLGVGPVVLAFFELSGFEELRCLVGTAGRSHQEQGKDDPLGSGVHAAVR